MAYGATNFTNNGAGMFSPGAGNAYAPAGTGNGASYSNPAGNPPAGGGKGGAAPAAGNGGGGPNVFDQSALGLERAMRGARGAMNYDPTMVNPATLGGTSLAPYMNPYQQSVINTTMRGLGQQQQQTMNGLDAQASAAGAFGGSRHGVAMGETNGQYADTAASTLAGLNSANYQQAQQGAMFDVGNRNAGQIANQQAGLAGAGLNLAGSAGLGNLSNLGFSQGMQINGQQGAMGAQQQALQQAIMQAAMQQFGGFTGAPGQSAAIMAGGANNVPYGTSGTNTTTQTPGLFDWLSLGASF